MLNGPQMDALLPGRHLTFIDSMPVQEGSLRIQFIYWGIWILLTWVAGFSSTAKTIHAIQE